jgi:hypothetical protein
MLQALQRAKGEGMRIPSWNQNRSRKRRLPRRDLLAWLNARRGRGNTGLSGGFVPVEPDSPKGLSGGAVVDPYSDAR